MSVYAPDMVALVRAKAYHLLAAGLRKPVGEYFEWIAQEYVLEWTNLINVLQDNQAFLPLISDLKASLEGKTQDELIFEYDRLFEPYGGLKAAPYETEYTKLTPMHGFSSGFEMADLGGFYKAFGLEPNNVNPERTDHIVTELEFMHILACKEADAERERNQEHLDIVVEAQQKFVDFHVQRWPKGFVERLEELQISEFYLVVARLIELWVGLDHELLFSEE